MHTERKLFPFTAICGQETFKLALLLAVIDPTLGGVLILGDKGSGKTTTVRALSGLLHTGTNAFPFVNLPIGASEDRVLGSVDLERLINEKRLVVQKGLLAAAHNGLLYIDEVNLLNDYIMDLLLDASSSGGYYLEREGLSAWQDSRFVLVGTMNQEEGELRPQLLDRFGLCVSVTTPLQPALRAEIIKRRLLFDTDAPTFLQQYNEEEEDLHNNIREARNSLLQVNIPAHIYEEVAILCQQQQAEGMRADILIVKAARALAALEQCNELTPQHIEQVAPLVLAHRSKQGNRPPEQSNKQNENGSRQTGPQSTQADTPQPGTGNEQTTTTAINPLQNSVATNALQQYLLKAAPATAMIQIRPATAIVRKGQVTAVQKIAAASFQKIATRAPQRDLVATVQHYLLHRQCTIQYRQPLQRALVHLLLLVDSSLSMAAHRQISLVKGVINALAQRFNNKKLQVALVALFQGEARLISEFTDDTGYIVTQVGQMRSGGRTNMRAGFEQVSWLMRNSKQASDSFLYVFTDGRINAGNTAKPFEEAAAFFRQQLHYFRANTQIIDTEAGQLQLGMAQKLAKAIGCRYIKMEI